MSIGAGISCAVDKIPDVGKMLEHNYNYGVVNVVRMIEYNFTVDCKGIAIDRGESTCYQIVQ